MLKIYNNIPAQVNGISIGKKLEQAEIVHTSCETRDEYDPMPGGSIGTTEPYGDDDDTTATFTYFIDAENPDGECGMLTVAHPFVTGDTCFLDEMDSYQSPTDNYWQKVGTPDEWDLALDLAWIPKSASLIGYNGLLTDQGVSSSYGFWDNIDYLEDENPTIYSMGSSSGVTTGELINYDLSYGQECAYHNSSMKTECNLSPGDSGGPQYAYWEGDPWITMMNQGGQKENEDLTPDCTNEIDVVYKKSVGLQVGKIHEEDYLTWKDCS